MPPDHWARDPEDRAPEEEGTGTCDDVPPAAGPEALGPAGADCAGAPGAAAQLPGPFAFGRPGGKSIADALARLHREGQEAPEVKIRRLDHGPLLSLDFQDLEIRTMAQMAKDLGFIVIDEPVQVGHSFYLQAHRGSGKPLQDAELVQEYSRKAREEVIPLVCGPEGSALAEFLRFRDFAPMSAWDPAWCAPPDLLDGPPQKGRSPKAYHHQFQPGEGRRETAPSRNARDAARAARKAKKKGRR